MEYQLSAGMIMVKTDSMLLSDMERVYQKLYPVRPALNWHTVYENEYSRKAGILGELVFAELYTGATKSKDLRYDFLYKGNRVDVKCKYRHVPPDRYNHEASIFEYQSSNKLVDIYYFMSTITGFDRVWLCGYITKKQLLAHPLLEHWKKNAIDNSNGKRFGADSLSICYEYLNPVDIDKINQRNYLSL